MELCRNALALTPSSSLEFRSCALHLTQTGGELRDDSNSISCCVSYGFGCSEMYQHVCGRQQARNGLDIAAAS